MILLIPLFCLFGLKKSKAQCLIAPTTSATITICEGNTTPVLINAPIQLENCGDVPKANKQKASELSDVLLVPNPASNICNVYYHLPTDASATLIVADVLGRKLAEHTIDANAKVFALNTSNLISGAYFVSILQNKQLIAGKQLIISK